VDRSDRRMQALSVAFVMSVGGNLPMFLTGALAVQVRAELGFADAGLGVALAAPYLTGALLAAPIGRLADRLGWRRAVRLAGAVATAVLVGIGLGAVHLAALVLLLSVAGAALSMSVTSASLIIAEQAPVHRRGLVFGAKQSAIPLAAMLAGLAVPALGVTVGWRWAYVAAAAVPLAAVGLVPRGADRRPPAAPDVDPLPRARLDVALVALTVAGGMASLTTSALAGFLVPSAVDAGISVGVAGLVLAAAAATSLVVRMSAGMLVDRFTHRGVHLIAALLLAGAGGHLLLAAGQPTAVAIGGLLAYGAGWGWPGLIFYALALHWPRTVGEATGVAQIGLMLGMAAGPLGFGAIASVGGYSVAWTVTASTAVLAALLFVLASRRFARE
jgi:MFS family permease